MRYKMKKIFLIIMILISLLSAQIFRQSESGDFQRKIEYLQDGILLRFDLKQVERIDMEGKPLMWEYKEFWIPLNMKITDIQKVIAEKGYKLAIDEIEYLQGKSSLETSTYWKIATVKLWLDDRNIEYPIEATKNELQLIVNGVK